MSKITSGILLCVDVFALDNFLKGEEFYGWLGSGEREFIQIIVPPSAVGHRQGEQVKIYKKELW